MIAAAESPTVTNDPTAPRETSSAPVVDTERANRAAALATLLMACRNAGVEPDPALVHEHDQLNCYVEVDVKDDHLVVEAQIEPGTLGWEDEDGREPASATLIANRMLAV